MLTKKLDQKGLGLIETLLALAVSIIIVTSMVSLAIFTLRASLQNKLLLSGTQQANQEIELVRAFRDGNTWQEFIDEIENSGCFGDAGCHMDSSGASLIIKSGERTLKPNTTEELKKSFRTIDINGDKSLIRVAVTVGWTIGQDAKYAHNYTELSNWRSQ